MIPILYQENETNFENNGLGILVDLTSCLVTENRNGTYELELTYPVGSFLFEKLMGQQIIKVKANDRYAEQLFRIYHISKPLNGKVTVKGEHICYKLKDNFIPSLTYSGTPASCLNAMDNVATYKSGFSFGSDITALFNFNFNKINFLNAILGTDDTSLINTIGDYDVVRDNFNFNIKVDGGQDKNVLIAYKKNITSFECTEDFSNIVTKIYPYATSSADSSELTLTEKYIESEYINYYTNAKVVSVDFTSYFAEGEIVNETTLREKASTYFIDTKCDIPKLNYNIEFVSLSKTEEYKDFAVNEGIGLNDTVIIRHEIYGLDSKVKVTKTVYDSIAEKYTQIELGQPKESMSTIINTTIKNATKDKVTKGFLDGAISELSNAITGYDGGYVRLNPPSNPSEILIMDNENINLAQTVWRWNKDGWGVSRTGYNGNYVGLTRNGKLVVDETTCNTLTANFIKTAVIDSINSNSNYFHLDPETGIKAGNIANGDYTVLNSNGLKHHIGSLDYDYTYVAYEQFVSLTFANNVSDVDVTFNYDSALLSMLNGKIPKSIIAVVVNTGGYYVPSNYVRMGVRATAYCTNKTATGFTLHGNYVNTALCNRYTNISTSTFNLSYGNYGGGGDMNVRVIILA